MKATINWQSTQTINNNTLNITSFLLAFIQHIKPIVTLSPPFFPHVALDATTFWHHWCQSQWWYAVILIRCSNSCEIYDMATSKSKQQQVCSFFIQERFSCWIQPLDSSIESICCTQFHYRNWPLSNFVEFKSVENPSLIATSMNGCFNHDPKCWKIPNLVYPSGKPCVTLIFRINYQ